MADHDEAARLDRLIEARRAGAAGVDAPGMAAGSDEATRDLLDLAAGLDALGRRAPVLDVDTVWSRVSAGIDAAPRSLPAARSPWWRPSLPTWMNRPAWSAAGAFAAVLVLGVFVLVSPPRSTSAAFFDDVAELSAVAEAALSDDVLTEDEKGNLAALATVLLAAIDRNPAALDELGADQRQIVLDTLSTVMGRLTPIADQEVAADLRATGPSENASNPPDTGRPDDSGPPQTSGQPDEGGQSLRVDKPEQAAQPVLPTSGGALRQGRTVVAPSVAASVTALGEVNEAVERAHQRGKGRGKGGDDSDSGSGAASADSSGRNFSTATPGYLAGVCADLRGTSRSECNRAVNSAISACRVSSGNGNNPRRSCEDAISNAAVVCDDLLHGDDEDTCKQALDALWSTRVALGVDDGDASGSDRGRGRSGRGAEDGEDDDGEDD